MNEQPTRIPTNEEYNARRLRESIEKVAAGLRDLAARVESNVDRVDEVGRPGIPTYSSVVERVQHDLTWGFANLNADNLNSYAAGADIARAKGE